MADSDEEYERHSRSRDKFRRERNDYEGRSSRDERRRPTETWEDRSRETWSSRSREQSRRDPYGRDYDRRRERYSPGRGDMSPPQMKRMRRDWDDGGGGYGGRGGYDMPYQGGPGHGGPPMQRGWGPGPDRHQQQQHYGGGPGQPRLPDVDYPTQPSVMSFKQFLANQDDNISDDEAVKRFNLYKVDFQKQQISDFFLAHKDEEWFKAKYHPEECGKRKDEQKAVIKARVDTFLRLLEMGRLNALQLDVEKSEHITKILDAAVILLEGGTEKDLKVVDNPELADDGSRSRTTSESQPAASQAKTVDKPVKEKEQTESEKQNGEDKKKKPKQSESDSSSSESDSGSDSESEPAPPGIDEPPPPGIESSDIPGIEAKQEETKQEEKKDEDKDEDTTEDKPRPLHRTQSIFFRNLAPTITRQEVEAMCRRYPGFLRIAIQDPQPERRFFRRGWVTFDRSVNIKDICWNISNIRLRDCEMGAIVNRELRQRVRPGNGIANHKQVMRNDIKFAAKIIQNLDTKWDVWSDKDEEKSDPEKTLGFISKNPVLRNITDFLVDEGSFEEEELLGTSTDEGSKESGGDVGLERDEQLTQVLDRMIMYLRIVHSIDYYSGIEYPNEHEMPHRCGIIHARGPKPPNAVSQKDITDWTRHIEQKLKPMTELKSELTDAEAAPLGKKKPEEEVEKFVTANTQELAKDKWLCPLSGKKFKGPDFIRKHLFNKHGEKIDDVKKEVSFFNNYLIDPKRPQLPEHPALKQGNRGDNYNRQGSYQQGPPQPPMMGGGYNQGPPHMGYGGGPQHGGPHQQRSSYYEGETRRENTSFSRRPMSNSRTRSDPRGIIGYRDLDAPDDLDIF